MRPKTPNFNQLRQLQSNLRTRDFRYGTKSTQVIDVNAKRRMKEQAFQAAREEQELDNRLRSGRLPVGVSQQLALTDPLNRTVSAGVLESGVSELSEELSASSRMLESVTVRSRWSAKCALLLVTVTWA